MRPPSLHAVRKAPAMKAIDPLQAQLRNFHTTVSAAYEAYETM